MGRVRSAAFRLLGVALFLSLTAAACSRTLGAGPVEIRLRTADDAHSKALVEVVDLPADVIQRLKGSELTRDQWATIFRVATASDQPAMLGAYSVSNDAVRFTPMFPLDPGRDYFVAFSTEGIAVSRTVSVPAIVRNPSTTVARVFPSSDVVPENQLRLYIHFSAPMGRKGGLDYVKLLDDQGREVVDPFLPLDAEFWNDDHTRYTVFFDPGRQKRGILPNQQMGRSLEAGRRYTLVVSREWRDANGLPLKNGFRREFRVAPADEAPLDPETWNLHTPSAESRHPLVVTFPEVLDHGLMLRALGVSRADGTAVNGDVAIEERETRWTFTPREPWRAGEYRLVALGILEDTAGNRMGRAFEVDRFDRFESDNELDRARIPFVVFTLPTR